MMKKNRYVYLLALLTVIFALSSCTGLRTVTEISEESAEEARLAEETERAAELERLERQRASLAREESLGEKGFSEESYYEERLLDDEKTLWPELPEVDSELMRLVDEEGRLFTIYFDYDSHSLSDTEKDAIKMNARWLLENEYSTVKIAGHADERGTEEYNLALGQRRAENISKFLSDLGVEADRLATITYGEEKPAIHEENEEAYSKNRRVEFNLLD